VSEIKREHHAQTLEQQAVLDAANGAKTFSDIMSGVRDRGCSLVSVTDGIDSSTAAGRMMIGVLGSLAEYESD
jgi:DNA invertase Pin-like site-specific DNA recombinase